MVKSGDATARIAKCEEALFVIEGKVFRIRASAGQVMAEEIPEIYSDQEETGTRIVIYLKYAAQLGYRSAVVRTPDSDIFFVLLHHASSINLNVYLDTDSGKHRRLVNVSDIASEKGHNYCASIMGLYVFTGEDVTSAFKGKCKVGPWKNCIKVRNSMQRLHSLEVNGPLTRPHWLLLTNSLALCSDIHERKVLIVFVAKC